MKTKQNNKTQDEKLFYPRNIITEDIAIQKVLIVANRILKISENASENFKISFGYRALNKLFFSSSLNRAKNLDSFQSGFDLVSDKSIENITYCLEHEPLFIGKPQMYFSFDIDIIKAKESLADCEQLWVMDIAETTDPKNFLSMFKRNFNLFDLINDKDFDEDLINKNLINFYFKFDVKYAKKQKISDKASMQIVFQLADENFLMTYSWSFNLKSFLTQQSEPTLTTSSILIDVLLKDSCIRVGGQ